jgi:ABC-type ATPase with predicted acetyltransferase domain
MRIVVNQEVPHYSSYAAERTRGMYNVHAADGARFQLDVELPLEKTDWQIGMIVGPSGSGKSSIVGRLQDSGMFAEFLGGEWNQDKPIIEVLGDSDYAKATAALSAVGLGSVPSWLRPYHVLSTGERFRADMAALLLSGQQAVMMDEFTSVLDRQVAQVGAGAFAKAWRRKPDRKIILVTCHYDVLDWIQPDWWIDVAEGLDEFHEDRGVIQARKGQFQSAKDRARYCGDRVATLEI